MATYQATALQVRGLGKHKMAAIVERAKRLGMTPQGYIKHLVKEDLAISDRAKTSSFAQLLGPGREVNEAELDRLVEDGKVALYKKKSQRG
jgi:hypothetical protein